MGKILTYEDIEAKGGTIDRSTIMPSDEPNAKIYEGDNHCPSAKDWDLRVYNVKNPYSPSSTQCTDTIDTTNAYKASFGYGCLDSGVICSGLNVTFENGLNYKIKYDSNINRMSTRFRIGTSGYPSSDYRFYGFGGDQYLYYHGSSFYKITSMTIKLSKPISGHIQLYSGTYNSPTAIRLYNFDSRALSSRLVVSSTALTLENITIPYANFGSQSFLIFIGLTQDFK